MRRPMLCLTMLALSACGQAIQHGLDESQAVEIEAVLHEAGIEVRRVREGGREARYSLEVPEERAAAAIKLVSDRDLPRQRAPGFAEVFGKGSMVPTAVEENALYVHALSGEISRTLSSLDGVSSARVHLVVNPGGQGAVWGKPAVRPRASVLLKVREGLSASLAARQGEIQALVSGAVDSLDPASVTVMISELPQSPPASPAGPPRGRLALLLGAVLLTLFSIALALAILHWRRMRLASRPALEAATPPGLVPLRRPA